MMATMSYAEFSAWKKLDAIEPIGPKRSDFQAGLIASTVKNVNASRGSSAKSPHDFMPLQKHRKAMASQLSSKTVDDQVRAVMGALMRRGKNGGPKSR